MADLTELEERLHAWLVESDFETVAWSTKKAAKAFKVEEEAILEAVANLTGSFRNASKCPTPTARCTSRPSDHSSSSGRGSAAAGRSTDHHGGR